MRDTVQVDGVTLTRAQIEEAQRKLNEPDPQLLKGGDVIIDKYSWAQAWVVSKRNLATWMHDGGGEASGAPSLHGTPWLVRIGNLREIVAFYREAKGL